jgi:hypothetical protein
MGWQTFHRFADDDPNLEGIPSGSAYYRFYWSQLDPVEGQIRYAFFDSLLARAHNAGQLFAFRVMCAGTNNDYMHVPAWLKDNGCKGYEYRRADDGVMHWVPDMEDPQFREAHDRLIRGLGQRYDGHPDLDHVDIGSVGLWGEWHMSGTGVDMPTEQTRAEIVDLYIESFPGTPKVMLIGDEGGMSRAVTSGCGWRADCLGDMGGFSDTWNHMENMYPVQIEKTGAGEAWRKGPVAFETCWTMQKWQDEGWNIPYILDYALDFHASYINNKSSKVPEGTRPLVEHLLERLGYRLVLRSATFDSKAAPGGVIAIETAWDNTGVAPPYRDYRIAWRLEGPGSPVTMVTDDTIQGWMPGPVSLSQTITLPADLLPGEYRLLAGAVHPSNGEPAVRFAIEGARDDRWHDIGGVVVSGR